MNLDIDISNLNNLLNAKITGSTEGTINELIIDNRNFYNRPNTLFLAINGVNNDAHKFIPDLVGKGCEKFIVSEISEDLKALSEENPLLSFIEVQDSIEALQIIAGAHRKKFSYPVIGITGSNGKTIVKEWLYHFLKQKYNIVRSPKSYNSQIGVPLSLLQLDKSHTLGIIEAGISQPGEMNKLEELINPSYGVLTFLGTAHGENFTNKEQIYTEKKKLFQNLEPDQIHLYTANQQHVKNISIHEEATELTLLLDQESHTFKIPYIDDASIQNACTAIIVAHNFGVSVNHLQKESLVLPQIALRLEARNGINKNIIIDDSYSNDYMSLKIAVEYLAKQANSRDKVVILSDFKQDATSLDLLYQNVSKLLELHDVKRILGVGKNLIHFKHLFKNGVFFKTSSELAKYIQENPFTEKAILVKGARVFGFEKIGKLLEAKTHQTKLIIDLEALRNNILYFKSKLQPETKMMCMVKAFGYGVGISEVTKLLRSLNVDYLGAAYADEGAQIKENFPEAKVIVLNSEEGSFDKIITHKLEPSIYSFGQLDRFIRTLIDYGLKSYPVHIKLDTGMKRLGFSSEDLEELISTVSSQPEVRISSIFSHLAASDIEREDLFTQKQIQRFQYMTHQLETGLGYNCIKHILNTTGVIRFNHAQMNMVRLGLGMYGMSGTNEDNSLQNVASLKSSVSQIKKIKKGESVGYGRSQYALRESLIGIIPIGYADGYRRSLSEGKGKVWINGHLAPTFGKVCMDMTMIDLTDIPVKEGDEVEIFGDNIPLAKLAKSMNTIVYEVMTSISERVARVYLE